MSHQLDLTPRHLSLLSHLLLDGPMTITDLAGRLEVAPTTVSLMVADLTRKGVLKRHADESDRRRHIVSIASDKRPAIDGWLARGALAWRAALEPLTAEQRALFIDTLRTFEREMTD